VHGNERKQAATLAGLESAHAYLQAKVARQLSLKRTPQLSFEYDQTVERGMRMTSLIDELTPGDPADEPATGDAETTGGDPDEN
jgi:ribosome-binding factor A